MIPEGVPVRPCEGHAIKIGNEGNSYLLVCLNLYHNSGLFIENALHPDMQRFNCTEKCLHGAS